MKWYSDEDVSPEVARRLREQHGIDAVSSHEVGMNGASDAEQLAYAAQAGRILVTFNAADYLRLADQWWRLGRSWPGIAFFPTRSVPQRALNLQIAAVAHADRGPAWTESSVRYLALP